MEETISNSIIDINLPDEIIKEIFKLTIIDCQQIFQYTCKYYFEWFDKLDIIKYIKYVDLYMPIYKSKGFLDFRSLKHINRYRHFTISSNDKHVIDNINIDFTYIFVRINKKDNYKMLHKILIFMKSFNEPIIINFSTILCVKYQIRKIIEIYSIIRYSESKNNITQIRIS